MNSPQITASRSDAGADPERDAEAVEQRRAVVHVAEARPPGDRLLNRQDGLNARHLPDLGWPAAVPRS